MPTAEALQRTLMSEEASRWVRCWQAWRVNVFIICLCGSAFGLSPYVDSRVIICSRSLRNNVIAKEVGGQLEQRL